MKNLLKKLHIGSNHSEDSEGSSSLDTAVDAVRRDSGSSNSRDQDIEEEYQIQLALELSAKEDPEAVQIEAVKQISLGSCPPENTPAEVVAYRYWERKVLTRSTRFSSLRLVSGANTINWLELVFLENGPLSVARFIHASQNYNALSYDDKILDGFYDLYGILTESTSTRMPSLVDLQGTPVSDDISWEAILVNRAADTKLLNLEQKALEMAFRFRSHSVNFVTHNMVQKLATLVSDHMGGPVGDPDRMLISWRNLSHTLKANHGSMVLPLGSLTIGLARHRALLFKLTIISFLDTSALTLPRMFKFTGPLSSIKPMVLADSLGIPCRLVKGQQFTGSEDVAMNFVKIDGGREYIVDLMADPGTLIPSDATGSHIDYEDSFLSTTPAPIDVLPSRMTSSSGGEASSLENTSEVGTADKKSKFRESIAFGKELLDRGEHISAGSVVQQPMRAQGGSKQYVNSSRHPWDVKKEPALEISSRPNHPYMHARSPSWTEGVSSPAVRRMKVKDVSQYMMDAAKENPHLAQKLHDVLLESGVVAPPNLFTEMYSEQLDMPLADLKPLTQEKEKKGYDDKHKAKGYNNLDRAFLPPLPQHGFHSRGNADKHPQHQLDLKEVTEHDVPSDSEIAPAKYKKNVPVAAAAAAAAAVVASSMVVAVAKANSDPKLQLPVAAAATATAAAVVATTAAVTKQYEALESATHSPDSPGAIFSPAVCVRSDGDADVTVYEQRGSGEREHEGPGVTSEGERISDRSTGNESSKSDVTIDDVADCEIPWEDITLGERIGLGSYGEVYRGDWHGTEVAVKKFLDQDITGESLEEFKSEVRIMKRVRHPNVVLFMGAITRPPNLSIVTEFLPRGSLYRLIHRPNNQLDERRRLRMALDAARGMNYLHNCTPVIVHRDLKSPNLLVDKNWVVKVCDFGLSRMKHSTFLSSRSTAGTAEWMAPEVLRNEPSNEKCDVYSFGVILWELCTLRQPWGGMNPMQVVGAVGFQHRRLDIPEDMDPVVADIIRKCWQTKWHPSLHHHHFYLTPSQEVTTSHLHKPHLPSHQINLHSHNPPPQLKSSVQSHCHRPRLRCFEERPSRAAAKTNVESTDWIASTLTRRFGIGAGLAWVGFLAVGVVSEQIKTRFEVSQQEANTRDVEKEEEVVLPNGIRRGASPRLETWWVMNVKGSVQGSGEVYVNTFEGEKKKPLALVMGSRPYSKGICEGIEYVLGSMKAGGKRRVIIPSRLGFGEEGADLGEGVQIPPFATLEYVIEVDRVSIAPA
ncbi:UNVERIFIED_CONTAM: putative serine/threonine-protein kinase SIS8 [Sesamum radiatum]|uniref:peptidylprolyl isomerase n=1 Tax=Sesamum radiatum TaxID=300843 RepID=A0AAW2V8V8_SESRA